MSEDGDVLTKVAGHQAFAKGPFLGWFLAKTILPTEWNDAISGPAVIDVHALGDGWLLDDVYFHVSADWDDGSGIAQVQVIGWQIDPDDPTDGHAHVFRNIGAGNNAIFAAPDDWAPVSGIDPFIGQTARASSAQYDNNYNDAYGPPAIINDAAAAGPLQIFVAGTGDAANGQIDVWLLVQRT